MSSRAQQKQLARQQREAQQAALADAQTARRRRRLLGLVGALAVVVVAAAAYFSLSGGAAKTTADPDKIVASLAGITQRGPVAGSPDAKVSIVEYGDLQCPHCAAFSRQELPQIIDRFVKTGKATFELRHWAFLGQDSRTAAAAAIAAAKQNKALEFMEVFYARQQPENSGYVTRQFLDSVAQEAGLDVARFNEDLAGVDPAKQITLATTEAQLQRLEGTPSFVVSGPGGAVRLTGADDVDRFAQAVAQVSKPRPAAHSR